MRKGLVLVSILLLSSTLGCLYAPTPTVTEPIPPDTSYYYAPPVSSDATNLTTVDGGMAYTAIPNNTQEGIESRLIDTNWISPGKVTIGNLYKGAQAEYSMRIHNGSAQATIFQITVRQPDYTDGEKLPYECLNWVNIPQKAVYVSGKGTVDALITVKMLEDSGYKGKDYEFWLSVVDSSQKGMIQTELCSRWLISTRK